MLLLLIGPKFGYCLSPEFGVKHKNHINFDEAEWPIHLYGPLQGQLFAVVNTIMNLQIPSKYGGVYFSGDLHFVSQDELCSMELV